MNRVDEPAADEEEIGRMLRALPPIEPPAQTVARTEAALTRARERKTARWVGRLSLAAAGVLATIGLTVVGRSLDDKQAPSAHLGPASPAGTPTTTPEVSDFTQRQQRGRYTIGDSAEAGKGILGGKRAGRAGDDGKDALGSDEGQLFLGAKQQPASGETIEEQKTEIPPRVVVDLPGYDQNTVEIDGEQTGAGALGQGVSGAYKVELATKADKDESRGEVSSSSFSRGPTGGEGTAKVDHFWRDSGVAAPPDTDADGIADAEDRCPDDEDAGDFGEGDGCPEPETTKAANVVEVTRLPSGAKPGKLANGRDLESGDKEATVDVWHFELDGKKKGKEEVEKLADETVNGLDAEPEEAAFATMGWLEQDLRGLKGDEITLPRGGLVQEAPTFIPAAGYFQNTYLPGDPEVAWLQQSVARGLYRDGQRLALEELARPVKQPFDAPRDQALALHVSADRMAVSGPTRMTVQVGLRGADQAPARRAPLAVALVVDLGSISDDLDRRNLWSVADAFVAERQAGDDMSVIVPGPGGPEVLAGDQLTASGVTRFLADAYERRGAGDLVGAVGRGYAEARPDADHAESALGASVVVLATAGTPSEAARLIDEAHAAALSNTQLAVIGAGARADGETLARIAGAGQGRRWLVTRPEDARRAVSQELGAAGRAVARAVRLRLKLAPGVQLIGVLGSRPLQAPEADRVREAERAIDKKVAATTGIAADRGADEDGIQIVIPAYMAGDDHVILLDVMVPGPGAVLEAHARFKDLVRMQNGEAHAGLSLDSGDAVVTPLTKNVLENRIVFETARALRDVAARIAAGDPVAARDVIVRARVSAEAGGAGEDQALLGAYAEVLADAGWASSAELAAHLARSLRLAAAIRGGAD